MSSREQLRESIRTTFGSIPFPTHLALRAAVASDEYAEPASLPKITAEQDIHGEWWEIPVQELRDCINGIAYLDPAGVEFYLPAYLAMALDDVGQTNLWVLHFLNPELGDNDPRLDEYFRSRLAWMNETKSRVCVDVLEFLRSQLDPKDPVWGPEFERIGRVLSHEFWTSRRR